MSARLTLPLLALLIVGSPAMLSAQGQPASSMRTLSGITQMISSHVHVIPANGRSAVANVGIVVGSRAVLVIESGLGKADGQVILEETKRIAGDRRIYLVATHSHLEHIGGEQAFPPSTVILRPLGQQVEIDSPKGRALLIVRSGNRTARTRPTCSITEL